MDEARQIEPFTKTVTEEDADNALMATLAIWGMKAPDCGTRVCNGLLKLDGVVSATVDVKRGLAFVDYVPTKTNPHALILAVAGAGDEGQHRYQAALIS